jgi:hypothetical protein
MGASAVFGMSPSFSKSWGPGVRSRFWKTQFLGTSTKCTIDAASDFPTNSHQTRLDYGDVTCPSSIRGGDHWALANAKSLQQVLRKPRVCYRHRHDLHALWCMRLAFSPPCVTCTKCSPIIHWPLWFIPLHGHRAYTSGSLLQSTGSDAYGTQEMMHMAAGRESSATGCPESCPQMTSCSKHCLVSWASRSGAKLL